MTFKGAQDGMGGYFSSATADGAANEPTPAESLPTPPLSNTGSYEQMMGTGSVLASPLSPTTDELQAFSTVADIDQKEDEREEREMFSKLEKPRVRYDVEVVTKLVVYTGMANISISVCHSCLW